MKLKYIFVLLCCCIYSVFSISTFIDKGQRAELYELLDDSVPTMKINMPNDDFIDFKDIAENFFEDQSNLSYNIKLIENLIRMILKNLKKINLKEYFPNYDFNGNMPQLQVGEDGFAKFDFDEVYAGFNFDPEYYKSIIDSENGITKDYVTLFIIESNENFKIFEILNKLEEFNYDNYNKIFEDLMEFKTKNATMNFELNGEKKFFDKVNFSIGGQYSRNFKKLNFNLKIKGNKDLYGRSHFKLRADFTDPTYLRTKLVSDIHNRLGLKSISANYIQLYINEEYMGLYIINDSLKLSWIEHVYGEKKTTNLYKCNSLVDFLPEYSHGCINENDDVNDQIEWIEFLTAVKNANSASDLEDIFEIDHFLYEMAIEYLTYGYDHINNAHNFFMYKQPNGKWIYLSFDFDLDIPKYNINLTFEEFIRKIHIINILILQDPSRFNEILKEVVYKVFNPSILYPHIDELKQFIKPYVELDKTPDSEGNFPGYINSHGGGMNVSMDLWDAYNEYASPYSDELGYGLKYYILMEYRYICKTYNMECDPVYMDENYVYPINEIVDYIPDNNSYDPIAHPVDSDVTSYDDGESITQILKEEDFIEVDIPTTIPDDEDSTEEERITDSVDSNSFFTHNHCKHINKNYYY